MALNLPQIMTGFFYWILGVFMGWLFALKLGGWVLNALDQTSNFYYIFTIIRWILFIFLAFILPYMMMQDKTILDKAIKFTGG